MKAQYHHGNLKNELIENAIAVISEHGLDAISIRDLSARCGVSHNAVYRHFENKEKLIDCCREYVTNELTRYLEQALSELHGSAAETVITRLGLRYIRFYQQHPTYYSAMYRNTVYKLVITLEETEDNYPPFEIFRKLCAELVRREEISSEDCLARLSRFWALLHGTVALIVSPEVDMKCDWFSNAENLF